jgi:hypothetical protein
MGTDCWAWRRPEMEVKSRVKTTDFISTKILGEDMRKNTKTLLKSPFFKLWL